MIVWVGFAALFLIYEGYALATRERNTPTLSRTIWWLHKEYPAVRLLTAGVIIWAFFHLVFGPCAFGIC
jgi:hypothetical protein